MNLRVAPSANLFIGLGGDVASALEDCNAVLHLTSDKFWIAQALEYRGYVP